MTEQPPARTKDEGDPILDPKAYVLARRDPAERTAFAVVAATLESTAAVVAQCFSSAADAREAMAAQHLEGEDVAETTFERVSDFENLVRRLAVAGTAWIAVNPPPLLEGNWRLLTPGAAVGWARQRSDETLVDYHARAIEGGLYGASVDRTRGRRGGGPVRPNRKPDDDDHRKGR